jgi:hypothetical protein
MNQQLEELAQYIRQTLPQSKSIAHLHIDEKISAVRFTWHAREFIVKPNLTVLELKGVNLYVTGASMLMQAAFMKKDKNEKVLGVVEETLQQVEDLLSKHQTEKGLKLLDSVKQTLHRLSAAGVSRR